MYQKIKQTPDPFTIPSTVKKKKKKSQREHYNILQTHPKIIKRIVG